MKIWFKMVLFIIISSVIGVILISFTDIDKSSFDTLSLLSVNLLTYFSTIYIIIKILSGILRIKKQIESFFSGAFFFFIAHFITLSFAIVISIFFMNLDVFHPANSFPVDQVSAKMIGQITLSDFFRNILSSNAINSITNSFKFIMPVMFFSYFIAIFIDPDNKRNYALVEIIKSIEVVIDRIALFILDVFPFVSIFIMLKFILQNEFLLSDYSYLAGPVFVVFLVTSILFFLFFVMLTFVLKESAFRHFLSILGAALTGLITGHHNSCLLPLNEHLKKNTGVDSDFSDSLLPLGFVFNRTGTVIVASVLSMTLILVYFESTLTLKLQLFLFIFIFLYSFRLDGVPESGFLAIIYLLLNNSYFHFDNNSYLIFIAVVPVFSRIAVFINVVTTGVFMILSAKFNNKLKLIDYKDYI